MRNLSALVALMAFAPCLLYSADKPMPTTAAVPSKKMPAATAAGHATGLIPREVLFGNPDKAGARMSHDGKWLSYLAAVDGVLNIWVAPIDKPSEAKPVTKEKDRPIHSYFWAYTNNHI